MKETSEPATSPIPLERPLYSVREAARLLGVPSTTLRRWLEGYTAGGRTYPGVIRPSRSDSDQVTWAEYVEAGFLNEYRQRRVSLQHMRPIVERMRHEFEVPYPLAHFTPAVDTSRRQLVLELQQDVHLHDDLALVVRLRDGQLQWAEPMRAFIEKVEFNEHGVAERMRPFGRNSPLAIDPEVAFGVPQVKGIRTEVLAEAYAEEGSLQRVAHDWELTEAEVEAALRWELSRHKVA